MQLMHQMMIDLAYEYPHTHTHSYCYIMTLMIGLYVGQIFLHRLRRYLMHQIIYQKPQPNAEDVVSHGKILMCVVYISSFAISA